MTFYNGLFTQQFVASGTVYTGQDGVADCNDSGCNHTGRQPKLRLWNSNSNSPGSRSREQRVISKQEISASRSITGLLVQKYISFHNGQDERTYTTVTQKDIHSISTVLKTTLAQQHHRSLTRPTQTTRTTTTYSLYSDCYQRSPARRGSNTGQSHRISEHAAQSHITARNYKQKQQHFLRPRHDKKPEQDTACLEQSQVRVTQASVTSTPPPLVFLSFHASGTWVYGLSHTAQEQIKHLIAGKTTQEAVTLLASLPGVEQASIRLSGFGDNTRLPKADRIYSYDDLCRVVQVL